jgi:serine/threonine-protein kinase
MRIFDRFIAITVLPPEKRADPEGKRRFVQEAEAALALNHPNIITAHDITSDAGVDFIVMEYIAGKTLDQLILRFGEMLKHSVPVADALADAHAAGIVHRDLKPSNMMVAEVGLVKLLDFGLAKLTDFAGAAESARTRTMRPDEPGHTQEGALVGTVPYMSPEQPEDKKPDAQSDIFSFGAMMYEMLTAGARFRAIPALHTRGRFEPGSQTGQRAG